MGNRNSTRSKVVHRTGNTAVTPASTDQPQSSVTREPCSTGPHCGTGEHTVARVCFISQIWSLLAEIASLEYVAIKCNSHGYVIISYI